VQSEERFLAHRAISTGTCQKSCTTLDRPRWTDWSNQWKDTGQLPGWQEKRARGVGFVTRRLVKDPLQPRLANRLKLGAASLTLA
jgi:hypothetical protein